MEVSVVVPFWNASATIGSCLRALSLQKVDTEWEVILVDDGSTDRSRDAIDRALHEIPALAQRTTLRVIAHAGVNAARNEGIRAARGKWVAFVDSDELAPPLYVSTMLKVAAITGADAVGGDALSLDDSPARFCPICTTGVAKLGSAPEMVSTLNGGSMMVAQALFDRLGGFREELSGRGDETEWFLRASRTGAVFAYDPSIAVGHIRSHLTGPRLIAREFRQAQTLSASMADRGGRKPSARRFVSGCAHSVVHRCTNGLVLAAREAGVLYSTITGLHRAAIGTKSRQPNSK